MKIHLSNWNNFAFTKLCGWLAVHVALTQAALGQTRILPPFVRVTSDTIEAQDSVGVINIEEAQRNRNSKLNRRLQDKFRPSANDDQIKQTSTDFGLEIPIPLAAGVAMPFVSAKQTTRQTNQFKRSQQFELGMLHHAAEGAPLWKASLGYWRDHNLHEAAITNLSLNLEKLFPVLRPNNSDRLDSWIRLEGIHATSDSYLPVPELGWTWRSTQGAVFDFIFPRRIMIGYHEDEWTGLIGYQEDNFYELRDSTKKTMKNSKMKRIVFEAQRNIVESLSMHFSAGITSKSSPSISAGMKWQPTF
ncbi:MAG: hypothetical protein NT027_05055 [Proteobacteria bacterium]|nr:hypothetical protein [Pseudomonadota bacterium]